MILIILGLSYLNPIAALAFAGTESGAEVVKCLLLWFSGNVFAPSFDRLKMTKRGEPPRPADTPPAEGNKKGFPN
jgi:hypothetical protein